MSMDAHLRPKTWQQKAQAVQQNPALKIFFFNADTLIAKQTNEQQLYFTLWHLQQQGHLLTVISDAQAHDSKSAILLRCLERIKKNAHVDFFLGDVCIGMTEEEIAEAFGGDIDDPHLAGKNNHVRMICNRLQLQLASSATKKKTQPVITNRQMVLVDSNAVIGNAKRIGMSGIAAETLGRDVLYQLLLHHTPIAHRSHEWLNDNTINHGPYNKHMAYFLYQFEAYRIEEARREALRKQIAARMAPKPKMQLKTIVFISLLGGCVVACIGGTIISSHMAIPFGIAFAGLSLKIMMAKFGILFGMGSTGGFMTALYRKARAYRRWLHYRKYIQALANHQLEVKRVFDLQDKLQAPPGYLGPASYTSSVAQMSQVLHGPMPRPGMGSGSEDPQTTLTMGW